MRENSTLDNQPLQLGIRCSFLTLKSIPWEIAADVRFDLLPFTFRINLDPVSPEPRPNSLPIYIQINDFRLQLWHVAINTILRDPLAHLRVRH